MGTTKIEWTEKVWNPVTGCSPISGGCRNCYARRMANRLKGRYGYPKDDPFRVTFHRERLDEPLHWKKPSRIFVCSMGDLFHGLVKREWIVEVIHVVRQSPRHIFILLTKRPKRMQIEWDLALKKLNINQPPINALLGVSISTNKDLWMVETLLQIPAAKRFVSVEPMLGPIVFPEFWQIAKTIYNLKYDLDWVICGGETGPGARPMYPDWVRSLRDQCQAARVPFFFKGWGEFSPYWEFGDSRLPPRKVGKKYSGHFLDGKEFREFPES